MEKTWRWFGKKDKITLDMLRQIGVEGIVTALHDVPNGEIWTEEAINDLKQYIESYGLRWSVVESLPVCEAIKYAGPERDKLIENYKVSLANLGKCGVKTVCYNFMPVIDWIRTDLQHPWADGTSSLYFDRVRFAYFDLRILQREGAEKDYSPEELAKVEELDKTITEAEKESLIDTIIVKTQGFVNGNIKEGDKNPVNIFKNLLALYKGIDRDALRENMRYFLAAIMPVCEYRGYHLGVQICYDLRFPETFQALSRQADLILVPANWPGRRREHWISLLQARAIENQSYIAGVNCVGDMDGQTYTGDSRLYGPDGMLCSGEILTPADAQPGECAFIYEIDDQVKKVRTQFPVKKDRRDALYRQFYEV